MGAGILGVDGGWAVANPMQISFNNLSSDEIIH